jgi:hypothetical protein
MNNSDRHKEITFDNLPSAVANVRDEISLIKNRLEELFNNFEPVKPTEYLTRHELAQLLKCDLSTIHNWTKKGILNPYGIGNRVYYKRNEVEATLVALDAKNSSVA